MKYLMLSLIFVSTVSYADSDCLLPPCPPPPTEAEIAATDAMFEKAKYILGAVFDAHRRLNAGSIPKNVPAFTQQTKPLMDEIKVLEKQADSLNPQTNSSLIETAFISTRMCLSLMPDAFEFCSQALRELKEYSWEKHNGWNWSGYPTFEPWKGFPETMY